MVFVSSKKLISYQRTMDHRCILYNYIIHNWLNVIHLYEGYLYHNLLLLFIVIFMCICRHTDKLFTLNILRIAITNLIANIDISSYSSEKPIFQLFFFFTTFISIRSNYLLRLINPFNTFHSIFHFNVMFFVNQNPFRSIRYIRFLITLIWQCEFRL